MGRRINRHVPRRQAQAYHPTRVWIWRQRCGSDQGRLNIEYVRFLPRSLPYYRLALIFQPSVVFETELVAIKNVKDEL